MKLNNTLKSCAKLILCGEYSLLSNGLGISLALNEYNTLDYQSSNDINIKFNNKIVSDDWYLNHIKNLDLRGNFNSNLSWELKNGWGSSGSSLANLCKLKNIKPNQLYYEGSGIDIWTSFLNKSILYKKDNVIDNYIMPKEILDQTYILPLGKKIKSPSKIKGSINLDKEVREIFKSKNFIDFLKTLKYHDEKISSFLKINKCHIKHAEYSKYSGTWGGDSVLLFGTKIENYYTKAIPLKNILLK